MRDTHAQELLVTRLSTTASDSLDTEQHFDGRAWAAGAVGGNACHVLSSRFFAGHTMQSLPFLSLSGGPPRGREQTTGSRADLAY